MAPLFPQVGTFPTSIRNQTPVYNPYQSIQNPGMQINVPAMLQQSNNAPNPVLVGVHGFDSVKQFPFKPNQTLAFHDLDADFEYVVDTDINNQPSFKILEFSQITEEEYREKYAKAINANTVVLTAEEYDGLIKRVERLEKEMDTNAQQSIRYTKQANNADGAAGTSPAKSQDRPANIRNTSETKPEQ